MKKAARRRDFRTTKSESFHPGDTDIGSCRQEKAAAPFHSSFLIPTFAA
ncbi:MAG: hypothetical protein NC209_06025 [Alistipes sp.]|nr:hypothetical protein [Alistipes sp.]